MRIGVTACDMGTSWMLPRLVGAGRAHELMMTARRFGAEEALRIGMLADAVPADDGAARVEQAIEDLLVMPPLSLSLEISSFDAEVELENRQQVLTTATADQQEAMAARTAARHPRVPGVESTSISAATNSVHAEHNEYPDAGALERLARPSRTPPRGAGQRSVRWPSRAASAPARACPSGQSALNHRCSVRRRVA